MRVWRLGERLEAARLLGFRILGFLVWIYVGLRASECEGSVDGRNGRFPA